MTSPYGPDPQQPPGGFPPAGPPAAGGEPPPPSGDVYPPAPDSGYPPARDAGYPPPPAGGFPGGQPPYAPPPTGQPPYGGPGGYGPPPPNRRRTGLIVGVIVLAALLVGGGAAAALLLGANGDGKQASSDTSQSPSTGPRSSPSSPTGSTPTSSAPPAVVAAYCKKLKTIDRDRRLYSIRTANPSDVAYALNRFQELADAAPPVIHSDWARVDLAIRKGLHGETAQITQSQLQQSFDHIKSEAQTDCDYTLTGGPFGG